MLYYFIGISIIISDRGKNMKILALGASFEATALVNSTNTAICAGSGSLPVLGTPFLVALMEKATCNVISDFLEVGETSVGTEINISHLKASRIGDYITATAVIAEYDGRKITFEVCAKNANGDIVGKGWIARVVVDENRFMEKVNGNEI